MPEFQPNPFWDYSLSLYGKPEVAESCIFLQDKYGLDVNLLLFCLWIAASGRGALEAVEIDDCIRRTGDWREQVIEPLRSIRRVCRDRPLGVPGFLLEIFTPLMHDIELEAEHVEQLVLADTVRHRPAETLADSVRSSDAERNLLTYVARAGAARDGQLADCLHKILRAAFPGQTFSTLTEAR